MKGRERTKNTEKKVIGQQAVMSWYVGGCSAWKDNTTGGL